MNTKVLFLAGCAVSVVTAMTFGGSLQAPPGLFKDLNDEILGDAIILNGKQLFIDDYIHVLQWNDNPDCHLVQARPIKLRFHLNNAKLYSFTPRIRHKHYVPSYD